VRRLPLDTSRETKIAVNSIGNIMVLSKFSLTNLKTNTRLRNRHYPSEKYRDQRVSTLPSYLVLTSVPKLCSGPNP